MPVRIYFRRQTKRWRGFRTIKPSKALPNYHISLVASSFSFFARYEWSI